VARIRRQARAAPERVALLFAGRALTYGELERASDALARWLVRRGAGCGTLVGICLERSPEMILGLVAILKAGAAFLPLDPSYPSARLAFMVEDSAAALLLTTEELRPRLPDGGGLHRARIVLLDPAVAHRRAGGPPLADPEPGDPAYVIYTSGSTGTPKGVPLQHRGLGNLAREIALLLAIGAGSRVLQFSSLSFDAAVWEIATALGAGATLCLAPRESLLPGDDLARTLRELAVTLVTLPPSALAVTTAGDLPALGTVVSAGTSSRVAQTVASVGP
jgi:non-ribosomal peptide synthetase component F